MAWQQCRQLMVGTHFEFIVEKRIIYVLKNSFREFIRSTNNQQ
jgi:hypothetical protein